MELELLLFQHLKTKTHLVKKSCVISRQQHFKVLIVHYLSSPEKSLASMFYKPILQLQTPHFAIRAVF